MFSLTAFHNGFVILMRQELPEEVTDSMEVYACLRQKMLGFGTTFPKMLPLSSVLTTQQLVDEPESAEEHWQTPS
ncbi:hypothetical protein RRG08_049231 [Elysia crispata]|uniref:Uncharacterized protein n=1 Tax=Elysia crispata TaxID=231223 RepID=A0AAE0YUD3_9GAST|nr:hypothetical protein RRG08_049231 [Elysia crispata]